MWTIWGDADRHCDRVQRRSFLKVGALGSAGLLSGGQAPLRAAESRRATPRQALVIYLAGGPSHYETFDPKPLAPTDIRGPYNPIATSVPGTFFCETVPKLAAMAERFSIIRSCCHDNPGHGGAERMVQTGYKSASLEFELPHDYPALGAIVAKSRGAMQGGLPTYMHLPNGDDGGAAFLGPAFNAFSVYSTGKPVGLEVTTSMPLKRLESRCELRASLDRMQRIGEKRLQMDALDDLERQALAMLSSTKAHEAFNLDKEDAAVRDRYGRHNQGMMCLLGRRFLEAGAGIVTIRMGSWDHHGNAGGTIMSGAQENIPPLDQALSALLVDLQERGLQDQVLVWVWGEFGRTPRINQFSGRDHWPQAMSILVSGGGLKAGMVYGETNIRGEFPADLTCSPGDFIATVYRQLEIDPTTMYVNTAGRPIQVLQDGKPLSALIA